jgi:ABC-type Na+ efflux pump permease subunit
MRRARHERVMVVGSDAAFASPANRVNLVATPVPVTAATASSARRLVKDLRTIAQTQSRFHKRNLKHA